MKTLSIPLVAVIMLAAPASAGEYAGAQDGNYRAADGDFILVESKEKLVGIEGLDCKNVIVQRGRLRAKNCWANGHLGGDVNVAWRIEDGAIISNGKRFNREAPRMRPATSNDVKSSVRAVALSSSTKFDGDAWWHNGSRVLIDVKYGEIRYDEPKSAIKSTVRSGDLLFRGEFHKNGRVDGVAYAFKTGCEPAAYDVTGTYPVKANFVDSRIVLKGASPKRDPKGCAVIGYTTESPNARLVFDLDSDV